MTTPPRAGGTQNWTEGRRSGSRFGSVGEFQVFRRVLEQSPELEQKGIYSHSGSEVLCFFFEVHFTQQGVGLLPYH